VRIGYSTAAVACLSAALAAPAFAAHPLLTEDTGTQGAGKFELEMGFALAKDGGARVSEFGPQLSYGALDTLDLIVRPTWLDVRGTVALGTASGFGDTALDVKWRFFERGALSFGVRAGVDLPTGDDDKGLGNGSTSPHVNLLATYAVGAWMLAANLAWIRDPLVGDRHDLWAASGAAVWSASDAWRFSAEVGTAQNPDPAKSSWLTVARFGAIATIVPGLDVDAGYQVRLTRVAPAQVFLAGATLRW
jgi:hypothetical protein